jgi:biopolymer transport protein ExbD
MFRGQLDMAPVLCVLFPLAFFGFFHHWLVLPAGTRVQLPRSPEVVSLKPGEPLLVVVVDAQERLFFENQFITLERLRMRLASRLTVPGAPRTLVIQPDSRVQYGRIAQLCAVARDAGIRDVIFGVTAARPALSP